MKNLQDLTKEEYSKLLKTGMFWEFYPEATGIYEQDCKSTDSFLKVEQNDIEK